MAMLKLPELQSLRRDVCLDSMIALVGGVDALECVCEWVCLDGSESMCLFVKLTEIAADD